MERTAEEVYNLYVARRNAYIARNTDIEYHRALFRGDHWGTSLSADEELATNEFQLVINYCRSTVLHFVGALASAPRFRVPRPAKDADRQHKAEVRERFLAGLGPDILQAWTDVEMSASKTRFGVLQVLWDPDRKKDQQGAYVGNPFIFRAIDPTHFYPCYSTLFRPDDFFYVIREDPDRLIEDLEDIYNVKLQATDAEEGTEGTCMVIEYWDRDDYYLVALTHRDLTEYDNRGREYTTTEEVYTMLKSGPHGYPRIPFFVLQNIRDAFEDPTYEGSLSDVQAVAELNKHLDWLMSEHAEEILLNIHRPTVYKSPDHQKAAAELTAMPGSVWDIGEDEDVTPVVWPPEPEMVQNHYRWTRDAIDDLSFIPPTAQGQLPAGVSGASMGIANTPLQRILDLKKPRRIETLKAVATFVLQVAEKKGAPIITWCVTNNVKEETKITEQYIEGDYYVDVAWRNMLPRDEVSYEAHQAYLFKTGVQTLARTLDKLGVEWVEAEMQQLLAEYIDPKVNPNRAMVYAQAVQALKALEQQPEAAKPQPQPQVPAQLQALPPGGSSGVQAPPMQGGPEPARGTLPVRPPAPSFQQMQGEERLTPFGPREMFGAGALPLRPQGPGINTGGA